MDARVRYTKKVIKEVFLLILKEKKLNRITVTEICSAAEINRATFYKYYSNPEDLLNQLEQERLEELRSKIDALEDKSSENIFRILLTDFKDNKDFYQAALGANGNEQFWNYVFETCSKSNRELIPISFPDLPAEKQEWLFTFLSSGFRSVLQHWQASDMSADIEELVIFMNSLAHRIMVPDCSDS